MFHSVDTHLIQDCRCLLAKHVYDADVLFGVKIRHTDTLAEHLV
jgi:hypothetical protein